MEPKLGDFAYTVRFFEQRFGIPFPPLPVAHDELAPIPFTVLLFGSPAALESPCVATSDIRSFVADAPPGYCVVGFDDAGVGSFDVHISYVDDWRRVWLRLNYAGMYTDGDAAAARIRRFLSAYLEFERSLAGQVDRLVVVDVGARPLYRVELPGAVAREVHEPMVREPRFDELRRQLLGSAAG